MELHKPLDYQRNRDLCKKLITFRYKMIEMFLLHLFLYFILLHCLETIAIRMPVAFKCNIHELLPIIYLHWN